MVNKAALLLAVLMFLNALGNTAEASWLYDSTPMENIVNVPEFPDVTWSMKQPDFWIAKIVNPSKLMFDDQQIEDLNLKLRIEKNSQLVDFNEYPETITGSRIADMIRKMAIPSDLKYVGGKKVSYEYYRQLDNNRNLSSLNKNVVLRYAFTIRQTDLRSFPTSDRIYNRSYNDTIDRFQETRLDPNEPLVILHSSVDGKWLFVQSFCYAAWIKAADVAFVESRAEWNRIRTQKFIVVKVPNFCLKNAKTGEKLVWEMGARIFLNGRTENLYEAEILRRNDTGNLYYEIVEINTDTPGIRTGYLPCSYQNIIYQAFKMYGMRFGWGGIYDSVDCSSFVQNVYRSFGIIIPRNSSQQAKMPVQTREFYGIGGQRYYELSQVQPGSILFMPGHIMLYLGEENKKNYIIHSFSSFGVLDKKYGLEENAVYAVAVTNMNIYRLSGRTFQDSVDLGKTIS